MWQLLEYFGEEIGLYFTVGVVDPRSEPQPVQSHEHGAPSSDSRVKSRTTLLQLQLQRPPWRITFTECLRARNTHRTTQLPLHVHSVQYKQKLP
jgi:hypothetical protein